MKKKIKNNLLFGKSSSLFNSDSIHSVAFSTYCGPLTTAAVLPVAQRYSNPGGNPSPGAVSGIPTSVIISQIRRISLKKSIAKIRKVKN